MNNQQTPNRECQYYNWNNNPNYPSYPSEYGARCEKKGEFFSLNAEGILSPDCSKCEEGKKQQMENKTEWPKIICWACGNNFLGI